MSVVAVKAVEMVLVIFLLIFLVGALLGIVVGEALCVRYVRQEMVDSVGPKLKRTEAQLDGIQSDLHALQSDVVNLALATRHAELSARRPDDPAR